MHFTAFRIFTISIASSSRLNKIWQRTPITIQLRKINIYARFNQLRRDKNDFLLIIQSLLTMSQFLAAVIKRKVSIEKHALITGIKLSQQIVEALCVVDGVQNYQA